MRNAGETADVKFPIPGKVECAKSRRIVLEVYGEQIAGAKAMAQKRVLAKHLLQIARNTQNDWVARFVLLDLAREEAVHAIDCPTALPL